MVELGADFAGLEEFLNGGHGNQVALRPVVAKDGAPPAEVLKTVLAAHFGRVIELFREWDDDGNNMVSRKEFRQALPMLGLKVERADADELFAQFDADGSGEIDYKELHKVLRPEADIADILKAGAAGEIELGREQGFELRTGLKENVSGVFGNQLSLDSDVSIVAQLQEAMHKQLARVIDVFREWDEDLSGTVSKKEFGRALPMLGLRVAKAQADELFDTFDEDGSGTIDYAEINKKLRKIVAVRKRGSPFGVSGPRKPGEVRELRVGEAREAAASLLKSKDALQSRSKARNAAIADELEARKHLARVKRRLARAQLLEAQAQQKARNRQVATSVRTDMDRRVGRDLVAEIAAMPAATEEEAKTLSEQLNAQLALTVWNPNPDREWFTLFKQIDEDGSGRISFLELSRTIRNTLRLSEKVLPHSKLQSLWRTLDEDASGYINAGEFGRFMRLGAHCLTVTAKQVLQEERLVEKTELKRALEKEMGKDLQAKFHDAGVTKASDEEVIALSAQLNSVTARLPAGTREWYNLFKVMDEDISGRISYVELEKCVRGKPLVIPRSVMPDAKLQAVWLRLDEDASGFVDAGEFGRFMRKGFAHGSAINEKTGVIAPGAGPAWKPATRRRHNLSVEEIIREEEHCLTVSEKTAAASTQRLREEARQIEEALSRTNVPRLPTIGGSVASAPDLHDPSAAGDSSLTSHSLIRPKVSRSAPKRKPRKVPPLAYQAISSVYEQSAAVELAHAKLRASSSQYPGGGRGGKRSGPYSGPPWRALPPGAQKPWSTSTHAVSY